MTWSWAPWHAACQIVLECLLALGSGAVVRDRWWSLGEIQCRPTTTFSPLVQCELAGTVQWNCRRFPRHAVRCGSVLKYERLGQPVSVKKARAGAIVTTSTEHGRSVSTDTQCRMPIPVQSCVISRHLCPGSRQLWRGTAPRVLAVLVPKMAVRPVLLVLFRTSMQHRRTYG